MTHTVGESDARRRAALSLMVRATVDELRLAWTSLAPRPDFETLRRAETGLIMVRGRMGGGGAPFNLGEVTVTRCVVRMTSGEIGLGHILGRDADRAGLIARFDALAQNDGYRGYVETKLLGPVAARVRDDDDEIRRETASTRVNFFTMVRGEDE